MEKENYSNGYNQDNTEPKLYDELPKEIVDMLMETHRSEERSCRERV